MKDLSRIVVDVARFIVVSLEKILPVFHSLDIIEACAFLDGVHYVFGQGKLQN